jgi:hypothetical protein
VKAAWVTLKDNPGEAVVTEPGGVTKRYSSFRNGGQVWQAEEVFVSGKWQRFFGFVGGSHAEKVPASEIEFPLYGWTKLAPGLDGRIVGPQEAAQLHYEESAATGNLVRTSPLPITVKIRNRTGLDQAVPTKWVQPEGGSPRQWPAGAKVALFYSPTLPAAPSAFGGESAGQEPKWDEMEISPDQVSTDSPGKGQLLGPAQEIIALKVDLHDIANFDRAGSYRLRIEFPEKPGARNNTLETTFTIAEH